jgi:hypothetical protein
MHHKSRWYALSRTLAASLGLSAVCSIGLLTPAHAQETSVSTALPAGPAGSSLAERVNGIPRLTGEWTSQGDSLIEGPLAIDVCRARGGQLPPVGAISPFPISLRLGAQISPRTKFVGGVDVTLSGFRIIPGLQTRIDADAIVSANFKGISTLIPVTIDQVYSKGLVAGKRIYLGGGIGAYIGEVTRFGGKVFAGADLTSRLGAEVDLHFAGVGTTLVTAHLRIGL